MRIKWYAIDILLIIGIASLLVIAVLLNGIGKTDTRVTILGDVVVQPQRRAVAYISGAVQAPGIYEFDPGERWVDLINRAGGFSVGVDVGAVASVLPLAALVQDGESLLVPASTPAPPTPSTSADVSGLVGLNSASVGELVKLPGIGEATAAKIIQVRPFTTVDQLLDVPGIGEAKFSQIRDLVNLD